MTNLTLRPGDPYAARLVAKYLESARVDRARSADELASISAAIGDFQRADAAARDANGGGYNPLRLDQVFSAIDLDAPDAETAEPEDGENQDPPKPETTADGILVASSPPDPEEHSRFVHAASGLIYEATQEGAKDVIWRANTQSLEDGTRVSLDAEMAWNG